MKPSLRVADPMAVLGSDGTAMGASRTSGATLGFNQLGNVLVAQEPRKF